MSSNNALKRQTWIEDAIREFSNGLVDPEIYDIIEQQWEAHLATLPPDPLPGLLREAREVIEWATRLLDAPDDRLHACELLDRINRELAKE